MVKVNDMEFMRLRTAKSSQIAKLIKMDADLLVISRAEPGLILQLVAF